MATKKAPVSSPAPASDKKKALETALAQIEKTYGKGVTKEVMESAISLRFLANKYYEKLWAGYNFTDEECLAYYEEHRNSFIHYDCLQITVPAADVATLTATTDEESFLAAVRSVITKNNFSSEYNRFADTIEKQVAKKRIIRCDYDPNTSLGKWVVEDERQPYDIHTKT